MSINFAKDAPINKYKIDIKKKSFKSIKHFNLAKESSGAFSPSPTPKYYRAPDAPKAPPVYSKPEMRPLRGPPIPGVKVWINRDVQKRDPGRKLMRIFTNNAKENPMEGEIAMTTAKQEKYLSRFEER